ncbi:MAG: hypothetical protein QOG67_1724 [Verrucomicrobiota bacterium]
MPGCLTARLSCVYLALFAIPSLLPQAKPAAGAPVAFPSAEALTYNIEWRLIYAGSARLSLEPKKPGWESKLHLESGGLVSKLYKLDYNYLSELEDQFCTTSTDLNAVERNRHRETKVTYDHARHKAIYVERDVLKNATSKTSEIEIPTCVSDVIGGLYKVRTVKLEPGQSTQVQLSDGKKSVAVRLDAQQREQLKLAAGTFNTIRYEAFVFNGILFARKGDLTVWITDDTRRLPVQIRARMSFPIGSITFELQKEEHF